MISLSAEQATARLHEALLSSEDLTAYLDQFAATMADRLTGRLSGGGRARCAVTLARGTRAVTVAVSDESTRALEEVQNRFDDGPCLTAMRQHRAVRSGDLRTETRWPAYSAVAGAQTDVLCVLGVPFDMADEAAAALNIYSDQAYAFDEADLESIRQDMALASQALRVAVRLARQADTAADLGAAMESRTVINLATGIIMGQNRCPQEEAFQILRSASNHRNLKLRDVAADLVAAVSAGPVDTRFTP